jgi:hypothetical protein
MTCDNAGYSFRDQAGNNLGKYRYLTVWWKEKKGNDTFPFENHYFSVIKVT